MVYSRDKANRTYLGVKKVNKIDSKYLLEKLGKRWSALIRK